MIDPVTVGTGAVVKAIQSAAEEGGKSTGGLVSRVFGPAADEIGEALRRFTSYRVGNVKRIAEAADRKGHGREGVVPPRLAHSLLEDGSWCDDELMAEYLGGVLASGRTPTGKDDRGVAWTNLITSMSSIQIRAHFVFYREWAHALHGLCDYKIASDQSPGTMYVDLDQLVSILLDDHSEVEPRAVIPHAVAGLARLNLIGDAWWAGPTEVLPAPKPPELPFAATVRVIPSHAGIELFGWASGKPGFGFREFASSPEVVEFDTPLPRLPSVLPNIRSEDDTPKGLE